MVGNWLPSTLSSIYSWFTPAVLFVLLNLVIGTIAIVSKSSSRRHLASVPELEGGGAAFPGCYLVRSLSRSPSAVLDRLRSFNLNRHYVEHSSLLEAAIAPAANQAPHFRASEGEEDGDGEHRLNMDRSQSDAQPTAGEMPPKLAVRIKKSASEKSAFAHFEREEIEDAAASVPEAADAPAEGDEVDARADDFIHRFRQQLKLQRLDSILRYKEMLGRRST